MDEALPNRSAWARSALLAVLGVALLAALVVRYGRGEVLDALLAADVGLLLAAFAVFCAQIPLLALRWWWVLRLLGVSARFSDILAAHCGSAVTNFAAPGHFGEALLSGWLGRTGRAPGVEAFTALMACKLLTVLISLAMLAIGLLGTDAPALRPLRAPALIGLGLGILGGALVLAVGRESSDELRGLARLLQRARSTLRRLRRSPRALAAGVALTALNAITLCVMLALVYAAAGAPLGPLDAVLLRAIDSLGHGVSGWLPGNLGVDEAVFTLASHHGFGVDAPLALTAALLHKGIVVGYVILAAGVFAALGVKR